MTPIQASIWALALAATAPLAQAQAGPDPLLARNLAATCANCHGTAGVAKGEMKSLAGRKEDELLKLLADYRSGAQPATIMHQIVKGYTEDQLKLVVKHFAALPAAKP
ncbi:c-type cytochrome [Roseateles microcysteis]|uniref:c-type cytochrome n=1 Tax=Roseateles microcysteis TaxID=3119057 RepID=UPI002FE66E3C